jgi:integrase
VELPSGVHKIVARGREYFYFQSARGTDRAGPRLRLPNDPHSPEFWNAIRQASGVEGGPGAGTVNAMIDGYLASPQFAGIAKESQYQYRRSLEIARAAWGSLQAGGLAPMHVQAVMDGFGQATAKANAFLSIMRTLSAWAAVRGLPHGFTEGVKRYKRETGHQPWTSEQIRVAHAKLTGMVRRGIMLYLYTGQRGSDIVRLGPTYVDENGFELRQRKTDRPIWCPIVPELAAEMATWDKRPGPFLRQANGRSYSRKLFWKHFDEARETIPELADVTLHGLRCTAVVRLRRQGLSAPQISDITGMSLAMIQRYCRFADRKINGQAALIFLTANEQRTALENIAKLESRK